MKRVLYILLLLACCTSILAQTDQESIVREHFPTTDRLRRVVRKEVMQEAGVENFTRLHPLMRDKGLPIGTYSATHLLFGLWSEIGHSQPMSVGSDFVKGKPGGIYGAGLSIELQQHYFKFQTGVGYRLQKLAAEVKDFSITDDGVHDTQGYPYHLTYDFSDRLDKGQSHTLQVPLMLGVGIDELYGMAGLKLQVNFNTDSYSKALCTTTAKYDQFLGTFGEMDHHGLRKDVPISTTQTTAPWTIFDLYGSLEFGWEIAGGIRQRGTTKYRPSHRAKGDPEWRTRLSVFCDINMMHIVKDVSLTNIHKPETSLVGIPQNSKWDFSTFKLNNAIFNAPKVPGLSDFVVGVKATVCIGFYFERCVRCKTYEIE